VLKRRWPLLLLAGALLAGLAFYFTPRARVVDVVAVERGPLVQSIVATGRVATPARIEISSQLAARIESIAVREGDRVRPGQLLVQLRSEEATATLAAARAALVEATDRIRQIAQVQRPVAEQQLAQAQANLELAEHELDRTRDLLARNYVSQAKADDAERALATTRAAVLAARAQAEAVREGGVEVELARSRLSQAHSNVAAAQARLELLALTAPEQAVVLTRTAEPGDTAQVGRSLLSLAQQGETRIIATVDEKNLRELKPDLRAQAVTDAFPRRPFEARVYYVAPGIDAQRGTVEVRLVVDEPPDFLRPDMTVSVEMIVGRRESALRLPADLLRNADSDAPSVLVIRDGRAASVPVELGLHGVGTVEIAKGLQEGEQVITPASQAIAGDRVRPRTSAQAKGNAQPIPGFTN
jgi:HlyD family secretion protein